MEFGLNDTIHDCSPNKQLMTDFDLMMILKSKKNIYRRAGSDIDVAKRNDDQILELLETMQQAAYQDRQLNRANKPATKKIALLKHFLSQLIKKDLQLPLLEHNVLNVLADWISPLPSKALPCLQIREGILKMLGEFPTIEKSYLKQSGIGKAVMYLYKHPDETNANRRRAGELIHGWFRTIYNVNTELKAMSREERQQFEMKQMPANKRKTTDSLPSAGCNQLDEALWLDKRPQEAYTSVTMQIKPESSPIMSSPLKALVEFLRLIYAKCYRKVVRECNQHIVLGISHTQLRGELRARGAAYAVVMISDDASTQPPATNTARSFGFNCCNSPSFVAVTKPAVTASRSMSYAIRRLLRAAMCVFSWFVMPYSQCVSGRIERRKLPPIEDPLLLLSATVLAERIRKREIRSEDVVRAYIQRCQQVNPLLNAIVEDRFEAALEEAQEVDRQLAKGTLGPAEELARNKPLLGLPVSIKESLAVEGMSNTAGRKLREKKVALSDAPVVHQIKRAGGIVLLVSNTPELCLCWETYNQCTGLTRNPYNLQRTAGGSSGGEAALIAAAGSLLGVTTDIAGSSRLPAMFTGVFGHKPSPYVVSPYGHHPSCDDENWGSFFTPGAMCRYAEDLPLLLEAMRDPEGTPVTLHKPVPIGALKCYYMENDGPSGLTRPIDADIVQAIRDVAAHLNAQRVNLKRLRWTLDISVCKMLRMKNVETIYSPQANGKPDTTMKREVFKYLLGMSQSDLPSVMIGPMQHIVNNYIPQSRLDFLDAQTEKLRKDFIDLLGTDGVFIYPGFPNTAHRHYRIFHKLVDTTYMMVFNTVGLPAASCMVGFDREKLPIGVQIVAAPGQDHLIFAVAKELERRFGGWVAPV
uniref:TFIIS N-terminal domain-containing protein n=1 Tax=Anopheles melas TaxID=34690 RepID=A0A182TGM9_9DIPT